MSDLFCETSPFHFCFVGTKIKSSIHSYRYSLEVGRCKYSCNLFLSGSVRVQNIFRPMSGHETPLNVRRCAFHPPGLPSAPSEFILFCDARSVPWRTWEETQTRDCALQASRISHPSAELYLQCTLFFPLRFRRK